MHRANPGNALRARPGALAVACCHTLYPRSPFHAIPSRAEHAGGCGRGALGGESVSSGASPPTASLRLKGPGVLLALLANPALHFGEAYTQT